MSRISTFFFGFSGLSFAIMMAIRLILGEWQNYLFILLAISFGFAIAAILKDIRFFKDLFFMRTTKHGLNFGVTVILALVALGAVNYVAYVQNKKYDVTEEKMNSLSDQTIGILKNLDDDLEIIGFFKGGSEEDERERFEFIDVTNLYRNESGKVKISHFDPLKRPDLQTKYKIETSGEIVLSYKGKQNTLQQLTEESLTNAIIKITRTRYKNVYFLKGHGERDSGSEEREGISRFRKALED
ncbi:MAG: Gldg family protein, partial [Bdellovibrionia bacterium]